MCGGGLALTVPSPAIVTCGGGQAPLDPGLGAHCPLPTTSRALSRFISAIVSVAPQRPVTGTHRWHLLTVALARSPGRHAASFRPLLVLSQLQGPAL